MEQHTCKNCENLFEGNFCNVCGQKIAHRLDVSHIWHEVIHLFTHADKGIFAFIPKIITKPGIIALDYVEGKRKRYFNPLQYLVILVGIVTFLVAKSHFMEQVMSTINTMNDQNISAKAAAKQRQIVEFFQKYFNVIMFVMIPVFSFFSWLLFKKKNYNYAENVLVQVTLQAQSNTILIFTFYPLLLFFGLHAPKIIFLLPLISLMICMATTYAQFFELPWWVALIKGILIYICTIILIMVIAVAGVLVFVMLTGK